MEQIHDEHPDMGYRRIRDILEHDYNIKVNDKRVLRICRKKKIRSIINTVITAAQNRSDPAYVAENILNRSMPTNSMRNGLQMSASSNLVLVKTNGRERYI